MKKQILLLGLIFLFGVSSLQAQVCPDKNVQYWQAFPPGGESDISARHQQLLLKRKCANIETIIQYLSLIHI